MTKHFHRDMENLHRDLLALSAIVEEMIESATRALEEGDAKLARQTIEMDEQVDDREVQIEETCLKMLALHQPVAVDLRRIATMLKANGDLERIADLAVNVAERAIALSHHPEFAIPAQLKEMVDRANEMVRGALDAFVNLDAVAAAKVCKSDDVVDRLNDEVIEDLHRQMKANPATISPALHCFSATRHIERIADHATNIAEDVIYLVQGDIVRHRHGDTESSPRTGVGQNHYHE
jgi:phosphate transport system protein